MENSKGSVNKKLIAINVYIQKAEVYKKAKDKINKNNDVIV